MRKRIIVIIIGLTVVFNSGCAGFFSKASFIPVKDICHYHTAEEFALALPLEFALINTIIFKYRSRAMSAIGYTAANIGEDIFSVVCLNPVGIKLFELNGDSKSVDCKFAIKELAEKSNFADTIAKDIRKIYFDRVPAPGAEIRKKKHRIIFREPKDEGIMEYVFSGAENFLVQKQYYCRKRRIWSVFYYDYCRKGGKLYPFKIILKHYQYRYQLVVYLKEIRA